MEREPLGRPLPTLKVPPLAGDLGEQLKMQLVELNNVVGSMQLRSQRGGAAAPSAPPESASPEGGGHGAVAPGEVAVLRLQMAALAQSLAGLSACVVNWSSGQSLSQRRQLLQLVLRYVEPCEELSEELKELCEGLQAMLEVKAPLTVDALADMLKDEGSAEKGRVSGRRSRAGRRGADRGGPAGRKHRGGDRPQPARAGEADRTRGAVVVKVWGGV